MAICQQLAQDLIHYIHQGPSPFHAVAETARRLREAGFEPLDETACWALKPGDRRYVIRNGSSMVAWVVGTEPSELAGFEMVGAHTDSPCFKVKPAADVTRAGLQQVAVEPYGSMLLSTWMDRDLAMAGRVVVGGQGDLKQHLVRFDEPVFRIPNVAIHLDREVNTKGLVLNPQQHMVPIGSIESAGHTQASLKALLAKQLELASVDDILDYDLSLYDVQRGVVGGVEQQFVWSARLDNLASCHAACVALVQSMERRPDVRPTRMIALWDHEECGSRSAKGAQGTMIRDILERVVGARGETDPQATRRAIAHSFLISADMAHAVHPNFADRHEPSHAPQIGKGPVIKTNHNQSYASDGLSSAKFVALCRAVGFEPQRFVTRSDLPCGTTIGPITSALTGMAAVDVGNPMLSMHSIREMAGVDDHAKMVAVLGAFFDQ